MYGMITDYVMFGIYTQIVEEDVKCVGDQLDS
jgi:hypothetical protein